MACRLNHVENQNKNESNMKNGEVDAVTYQQKEMSQGTTFPHPSTMNQESDVKPIATNHGDNSDLLSSPFSSSSSSPMDTKINDFVAPTSTIPLLFSKKKVSQQNKDNNSNLQPEDEEKKCDDDNDNGSYSVKTKQSAQFPYKEPEWSGLPPSDKEEEDEHYSFEILKTGKMIGKIPLIKKPFFVFGRLPSCDVTLDHPSLSRYHAVIQFSSGGLPSHAKYAKGWYIYDLDSTHGTWVNKRRLSPNVYYRIKVGHVIKFGGSSRLHILQGPSHDQEEESEMSVTELRAQREKMIQEAQLLKQVEAESERQRLEMQQKLLQDRGCGWGMGEDAEDDEKEENQENPFASLVPENESLYIEDPKKALKGFYEREGCDLPDYQFSDGGQGMHKCVLDLPVDGPNGEELIAEAVVSGKRKDAVIAVALEACRMLDKLGMLRQSKHESRKRKAKKWEDDDFYDSDEDTFLDRTGTIEKKRFIRMKKAGKDEAETYESLMVKYTKVLEQIHDTERQLEKAKAEAAARVSEDVDELDAYMNSIKSGAMDTKTRMRLKGELLKLKAEEPKLRRLVNIAKPASLPPLKIPSAPDKTPSTAADSLPQKLNAHQKLLKKIPPIRTTQKADFEMKPDNFEEEDDEEEEAKNPNTEDAATSDKPTLCTDKVYNKQISANIVHTKNLSAKGPVLPLKDDVSRKAKVIHPKIGSTAAVLKAEKAQQKIKIITAAEMNDRDFASWIPPEEQSGDGRTSLNDKLGY